MAGTEFTALTTKSFCFVQDYPMFRLCQCALIFTSNICCRKPPDINKKTDVFPLTINVYAECILPEGMTIMKHECRWRRPVNDDSSKLQRAQKKWQHLPWDCFVAWIITRLKIFFTKAALVFDLIGLCRHTYWSVHWDMYSILEHSTTKTFFFSPNTWQLCTLCSPRWRKIRLWEDFCTSSAEWWRWKIFFFLFHEQHDPNGSSLLNTARLGRRHPMKIPASRAHSAWMQTLGVCFPIY